MQTGIHFIEKQPECLVLCRDFFSNALPHQLLFRGIDLLCSSRHGHFSESPHWGILKQPRNHLLSGLLSLRKNLKWESNTDDYYSAFADHWWRKETNKNLHEAWKVFHLCWQKHTNMPACECLKHSPSKESTGFSPSRGNGDSCSKTKSVWILNKTAELSLKIRILGCRVHEVFWRGKPSSDLMS